MAAPEEEIHIRDTEATGASKEGVGRWVLIFGTLIAIALLGAVALFGGLSQGDVEEEATVSGKIQSVEQDSANDGVLLGDEPGLPELPDETAIENPGETIPNERAD